jgi:hypothetical protein
MSTTNEESQQDDHGLNSLPANEREETQKILDEIDSEDSNKKEEDANKDDTTKSKEVEKTEDKPEDDKKSEDKSNEDDDANKDKDKKQRRDTTLIPAWKAKVAEEQKNKIISDLQKEIETLKGNPNEKKDIDNDSKDNDSNDIIKEVDELLKAKGLDDDDGLIKDLAKILAKRQNIPPEVMEKLKDIDRLNSEAEIKNEEINFSNDFNEQILPLIKAEYGDDIPEDKLKEIKESLKSIAYDPTYAKIPYEEIYRAKSEFRGVIAPKKKSAEGKNNNGIQMSDGAKNYANLTDEEVNNLTPDEFDKWSDAMAKNERRK